MKGGGGTFRIREDCVLFLGARCPSDLVLVETHANLLGETIEHVYTCIRGEGHEGTHLTMPIYWSANESASWPQESEVDKTLSALQGRRLTTVMAYQVKRPQCRAFRRD